MSRRGPVREEIYEERGGYYPPAPPQDYYDGPPPRGERIERVERVVRDGPPPQQYYDGPPPGERIERTERVERVRAPPVRARDLLNLETRERVTVERVERDNQPEFLRREIVPPMDNGQPLVLRARKVETFVRPVRRSPPRERSPSIERVRTRERIVERTDDRSPSPMERVQTRTRERIVERERSPSPAPMERVSTRTRERIVERERSPSPGPIERVSTRTRERVVERERSPSPARSDARFSRTRIDVRERSDSIDRRDDYRGGPRMVERETRERIRERPIEREPSIERVRTRERVVERERDRSPGFDGGRETTRTRVVETDRERERRRSLSSESSVSAVISDRGPPIIRAPPIHQEIITHHRHIDHGYDYAQAPTPPLSRRGPAERETEIDIHASKGNTDVDIYRTSTRERDSRLRERSYSPPRRGPTLEEDVQITSSRDRLRVSATTRERPRSTSGISDRELRRDRDYGRDLGPRGYEDEAEYYSRKTEERAYIGEAYNGQTKDWAIVDVPPGTERVKMDGVGGGSQEITWQRYNGVRRSNFIPERESGAVTTSREIEREEVTDRRVGMLRPEKPAPMWTEITKDLVTREAIDQLGYECEETEDFFYILSYLRYEDVSEIVRLSDEIKASRKRRIRDMASERERLKEVGALDPVPVREPRRIGPPPGYEEERVYERDVVYQGGEGRRGERRYR